MAVSLESMCYLCLNNIHKLGEQERDSHLTWIKIPFKIAKNMLSKYFNSFDWMARPKNFSNLFIYSFFFCRSLPPHCVTLLVVSHQLSNRIFFVSQSVLLPHKRMAKSLWAHLCGFLKEGFPLFISLYISCVHMPYCLSSNTHPVVAV